VVVGTHGGDQRNNKNLNSKKQKGKKRNTVFETPVSPNCLLANLTLSSYQALHEAFGNSKKKKKVKKEIPCLKIRCHPTCLLDTVKLAIAFF
jgi:hypothetical protein